MSREPEKDEEPTPAMVRLPPALKSDDIDAVPRISKLVDNEAPVFPIPNLCIPLVVKPS